MKIKNSFRKIKYGFKNLSSAWRLVIVSLLGGLIYQSIKFKLFDVIYFFTEYINWWKTLGEIFSIGWLGPSIGFAAVMGVLIVYWYYTLFTVGLIMVAYNFVFKK